MAEVVVRFLDDLHKRFEEMQGKANWKAVFGEVIEVDGRRMIPVASVQYGFGMGGGQGPVRRSGARTRSPQKDGTPPGGGGGGGGIRIEPVALIDITDGRLRVEPIINVTRLAVIALLMAGWSIFWMARAMRATIGVLILFLGIDVFVGGLLSFQTVVSSAFHLNPPQATKTLADFLRTNGSTIALIITLGFLIHALLVRFVPFFRYVYLTGHLMFWISVVVAATLVEAFPKITPAALVLWGSIIVAVYWSVQPMYIARYMRKVIGSDDYGFGHTSSAGCYLAARLAPYVGSKEKYDTERLRLPRRLAFFKDVNASTALVIGVIMLLAMLFADKALVADQAKKFNATIDPWVWGILVALRFAAGIAILLFGVRMFLAEIVPAFVGVSDRIIPGSKPALDVPTVFPSAPTAVMVGFLSSTVTFLILMAIFGAAGCC